MAVLTEVLDALIAPAQTLQAGDLDTTWVANPAAIRLLTYGASPLSVAVAHDHGAARGLTLDRALLSLSFGPHATEDTADAPAIGVPLYPTTGTAFSDEPKLMASCKLDVPGGVGALYAELAVDFAGAASRTLDLSVELRPLREAGYGPAGLTGVEVEGTLSQGFVAVAPLYVTQEFAFTEAQLATLGDVGSDREFEVAVWLKSNPQSTETNRLMSLVVYPGAAPATLPTGSGLFSPNVVTVSAQQIHSGESLTVGLANDAKTRLNQDSYGALGVAFGAQADTALAWRTRVRRAHQHTGRRSTHPDSGDVEPDGACLRYGLWSQHLGSDYGDTTAPNEMDTDNYAGLRIHSAGDTGVTWLRLDGRVSIPVGLGALDVRFALQPGTVDGETRLGLYAHLSADLAGGVAIGSQTNLITGLSSGSYSEDTTGTPRGVAAFASIAVDPIDGAAWKPNAARLAQGLGLWTLSALKPSLALPSGIETTNIYRVSQPVRIFFTVPKTGDYRLHLKLLHTGAGAVQTTSTRICWVGCVPVTGY
jgi:hypothetical protein